MKIKNIEIKSFGPLKNKRFKPIDGLNIFVGKNESGKTSLVDLIVKELFKYPKRSGAQPLTPFDGVERYRDTEFEGEITVSEDKTSYSLPGDRKKFNFEKIFGDISLSRLLCVESGDLSIPQELNIIERIKEKLTGGAVGLADIRKIVLEKAELPPTMERSKRSRFQLEYDELQGNLLIFKELREKLPEIHEKEVLLNGVKEKTEILRRMRLLNASQDYAEYNELMEKASSLGNISEEMMKRLRGLKELKEKLKTKVETQDEELGELSIKITEGENFLAEKKSLFKDLVEKLGSRTMIEFEEDFLKLIEKTKRSRIYEPYKKASYYTWITSLIFFIFTITLVLIKNPKIFYVSLIPLAIGFLSFFIWNKFRKDEEQENELKERTKIQGGELGLKQAELLNLNPNLIVELRSERKRLEGEIDTHEKNLKKFKDEISSKSRSLEEGKDGILTTQRRIEDVLKEFHLETLEEYEDKLKKQREINLELAKKRESLEKLLGMDETKWLDKIEKIDSKKTSEKYDAQAHEELMKEEKTIESGLFELEKPFIKLGLDNPYEILIKISEVEKRLEEKDTTLAAVKIFDEILSKISEERDLLLLKVFKNKDSLIYEYLQKILGEKRISEIYFEKGDLNVELNSGEKYGLSSLSRGTADQILFTFRLSILKEISKEPSFLLLDDPFLTSDYERRGKLAAILSDFVDDGWQVFYLTFDEHIKELLTSKITIAKIFNL